MEIGFDASLEDDIFMEHKNLKCADVRVKFKYFSTHIFKY